MPLVPNTRILGVYIHFSPNSQTLGKIGIVSKHENGFYNGANHPRNKLCFEHLTPFSLPDHHSSAYLSACDRSKKMPPPVTSSIPSFRTFSVISAISVSAIHYCAS